MLKRRFVVGLVAAGLTILGTGVAFGQNYPNKPIRIVTPGSGGSSDIMARIIAQGISGPLGQNVIVENRPSGIPGVIVSQAPPDGYTLLFHGSLLWIGPLLRETPYDAVRDFSPITWVSMESGILVTHPSVAANSVKELIALAKAKPGVLNYASSGDGSSHHLAAELFKSMAGVNIVRINYKGVAPAVNDVMGGAVQVMFSSAALAVPYIKLGRLKALAVTSAGPSLLFPGLPTVAASGLPGYESTGKYGMFAPAKTPAETIKRLNREVVRVINTAEVKGKLLDSGIEIIGSSPEELGAKIKSEIARMGKVIKDADIRAE